MKVLIHVGAAEWGVFGCQHKTCEMSRGSKQFEKIRGPDDGAKIRPSQADRSVQLNEGNG